LQGGQKVIEPIVAKMLQYNISLGAVWLQDWAGVREQKLAGAIQERIWWNWEVDKFRCMYFVYTIFFCFDLFFFDFDPDPNWTQMVSSYNAKGIRTLVYVNSFLADVSSKATGFIENYFKEAETNNYLLKNSNKTPYIISSGPGFTAGIVDFSNPAAVTWCVFFQDFVDCNFLNSTCRFQNILKKNVFGQGVSGYMADFGEYVPLDSVNYAGMPAMDFHNKYPEEWAKLNSGLLSMYSCHSKAPSHIFFYYRRSQKWIAYIS
jgi:alpha-glucosidase (family GH31 glycosyl hydrolase)